MKKASTLLVGSLLPTLLWAGCSSMPSMSSLASNPMIQSIVKQVGASVPQAVGGTGALLDLAQNKLPAADATKLSNAAPDMKQIMDQSKALGGFSSLKTMEDANAVMSKLGMNANQVSKMPQALAGYMDSAVGPDVAGLLRNIWR